jgi:HEAT repeat protein
LLKTSLIDQFEHRPSHERQSVGGLWGLAEVTCWKKSGLAPAAFFTGLAQRLRSPDRIEVISAALTVMGDAFEGIVVSAAELSRGLLDVLSKGDVGVSHASAWALGWLREGSPNAPGGKSAWTPESTDVSRLCEALDTAAEGEWDTRRWLATVLGSCGDVQAVPFLVRRLNDPDKSVRRAVSSALGQLGDKQTVASLLPLLHDPDKSVRAEVISALSRLGGEEARTALQTILNDPDKGIRQHLVGALSRLGGKDAYVLLHPMLNDPDTEIRRNVIELLGQTDDHQAIAALQAMLNDPDVSLGAAAAEALVALGAPEGIAQRARFLASSDSKMRTSAVQAYSQRRDRHDRQLLSHDLDGTAPWIDPQEPITEDRLVSASRKLRVTPEKVRSRWEVMATDLNLKLSWKG